MFAYNLDHICSYTATLSAPEVIGELPEGIRANFYITGGTIEGPRIRGTVLPVGADWLTVRRDGIGILDVRATLETEEGALIYTAYSGILELGEDGYSAFLEGKLSGKFTLRAAPRFNSAHPDYLWVNRLQCVNIGEADLENAQVSYDVYGLS